MRARVVSTSFQGTRYRVAAEHDGLGSILASMPPDIDPVELAPGLEIDIASHLATGVHVIPEATGAEPLSVVEIVIQTVLGPIEAGELGVTSMHEHLLADARILHAAAREPLPETDRVTIENLGFLRWNLLALEDNLVLDDAALARRGARRGRPRSASARSST